MIKSFTLFSPLYSSKNDDDEEDSPKESVTIDCATACLYSGAVAKNILDPILHDRNGHFNTVRTHHIFI